MQTFRAYDLPVRIFHWLFAVLFTTSFTIANIIDDESVIFVYHMLSGILMTFMIILRFVWGVAGSKTSRFSSFRLNPAELLSYFRSMVSDKSKRYLGHNPASSYAAVFMMGMALGLGFTGLMMVLKVNKHFFEELHELLANGFFVMVILHIAGAVFHQMKHRDGLIFSMLTGKKEKIEDQYEIKSNHILIAGFFVLLVMAFAGYLMNNYDTKTGKLSIIGSHLQLGKGYGGNGSVHTEHEDDEFDED